MTARRSFEVDQLKVLLVRKVEDQLQAGLLGVVEFHDAGEQDGAEGGDGGADRNAVAVAAQGKELHRERLAGPGLADAVRARRSLSLPAAAVASPERSPLMSARNTGTPAADSCSAIMCSVTVLPVPVAPATRPCRFIMDSGSRTWASL